MKYEYKEGKLIPIKDFDAVDLISALDPGLDSNKILRTIKGDKKFIEMPDNYDPEKVAEALVSAGW